MALDNMVRQIWKDERGGAGLGTAVYTGIVLTLSIAEDCVYSHLAPALKEGITGDIVTYGTGMAALTIAHVYASIKAISSAISYIRNGNKASRDLR